MQHSKKSGNLAPEGGFFDAKAGLRGMEAPLDAQAGGQVGSSENDPAISAELDRLGAEIMMLDFSGSTMSEPAAKADAEGVTRAEIGPRGATLEEVEAALGDLESVKRLEAVKAVAAAQAEVDRATECERSIAVELKAIQLKQKKAKIELYTAREKLRKAQANAAPKPQTLQDALKAVRERYRARQSDPATKKANKNARDRKYLDKLKADPGRRDEWLRKRNEAQKRRRKANRHH